ncbi:MAG: recombinase family protein [Lachnospiraceae bacterium]|nr:recombinase family protein [Lachnospiraceae bacterium]
MGEQLRIALYVRLSKEDEKAGENGFQDESNSIKMQRALLRHFVETHFDYYRLMEFLDDGYSGTNFNRPGVTKMLDLVKQSALDCIIVKDFSRFSRDYIEMGSYIEQIFPFMGVRFISVNDQYDSMEGDGRVGDIDVSFRNLLYDLYSRDLSVKVKSALAVRREKGNYISTYCPFGYEKDPNDKHRLLIEKDEAEVVRRIFDMALAGMTSVQIARTFNTEGVKTPIEFETAKGRSCRKPKGTGFLWRGSVICHILTNRVYVGDMVYGKYYKDGNAGGHIRAKEDWKIYYNHHAPIISRALFEEIQRRHTGGKAQGTGEKHPLTGKLICGCCGKNLRFCKGLNPYFSCPDLYVKPETNCVKKANTMFLEQFVLYELQQKMNVLLDRDKIWREREEDLKRHREELKVKRMSVQSQQKALQMERLESYERYVAGKRTDEGSNTAVAYQDSISRIRAREKETEALLLEMEKDMDRVEAELSKKQDFAELLAYCGAAELTRETVQKFIRSIAVKDEQHIEIDWRYF